MAILTDPIQEQNFELIRDQIGAIIKDEVSNQAILQPSEEALQNVKVFIDRLVAPNKSELPLINVYLDLGNFENQDVEAQDGIYSFNIDFYGLGKSAANDARGDTKSLRKLQRLMGVVRSIFQSVKYITLGFEKPSVLHRSIETLLITDPTNSQDGTNISHGRLVLKIRMVESAEMFTPIPLLQSCTTVKLYDTEKGFEYKAFTTGFNFIKGSYQGDDLNFEVQNEETIKEFIVEYTINGVDWAEWENILSDDSGSYYSLIGITFAFLSIRIVVIDNDDNIAFVSGAMPRSQYIFDGIGYNSTTELLSILADNSTGVIKYEAEVTLINTTDTEIRGFENVNQANGGNYIIFVPQSNEWELIRVRAIMEGSVCVYSGDLNIPLDSGVVFDSFTKTRPTEIDCFTILSWVVSAEDDIEKYEIYRDAVKIGEVLQGATYQFTDDPGSNGSYSYYIKAIGLNGGFTLDSNTLLETFSCYPDGVAEPDVGEPGLFE